SRSDLARREDALVHPAQENAGKLQSLRGVNRHQAHLVLSSRGIAVREQRHMGEVMLQRALLPAGRLILIDRLLELREIVEPFLAALRAEHLLIAAVIEQRGQKLRDLLPVRSRGIKFHKTDELPGLRPLEDR